MGKLIGWNRTDGAHTLGWTDDYSVQAGTGQRYEIERHNVRGAVYFTVSCYGKHIGDRGTLGLAKALAERDAELRSRRGNPVVRRYKDTREMRRAGVPDILPGTSTLIYESGRTVPLTEHRGHFLSSSARGSALMHRRQVGDEGEFRVVGLHDLWGERVRANPRRRGKSLKRKNPGRKSGLPTLVWDEPKGAATPRGWVRLSRHPDARGADDTWANESRAVGFYLTYPGRGVMASAYLTRLDPNTRSRHESRLGTEWFPSPAEAKRWIARRVWAALRRGK